MLSGMARAQSREWVWPSSCLGGSERRRGLMPRLRLQGSNFLLVSRTWKLCWISLCKLADVMWLGRTWWKSKCYQPSNIKNRVRLPPKNAGRDKNSPNSNPPNSRLCLPAHWTYLEVRDLRQYHPRSDGAQCRAKESGELHWRDKCRIISRQTDSMTQSPWLLQSGVASWLSSS